MSFREEDSLFGDDERSHDDIRTSHADAVFDQEVESQHGHGELSDGDVLETEFEAEHETEHEPEHTGDEIDLFGSREDHHGRRLPGSHGRHAADHDGGGKFTSLVLPIIALAVLIGLGFGAYKVFAPMVTRVLSGTEAADYPGPGSGEATITVAQGDTGSIIAQELVDAGVIASTRAFVEASSADPAAAAAIQPGQYTLLKEMRAADALAALNDANNRYLGEKVTIREGLWKSEIFAALSTATGIPVADYEAAAEDSATLGVPAEAEGNIEGWVFPATYTLKTDDSAEVHLKILVDEMKKQLKSTGAAEAEWQRVLTIASIVEGEARANVDLGKVARVIENRLDDPTGPTLGFLQMDSTVNYALQKRGNLTRTEYESAKTHPYDTYAIKGLPPGPIGNPGLEAIKAAVEPTEGPWFYFVTVNLDTGETLFAETFDEHERNDAQRKAWCADNPGKCTGGGD